MPLVTAAELAYSYPTARNLAWHLNSDYGAYDVTYTEEQCADLLAELKDHTMEAGYSFGKEMRPWYIIPDYFNRLDENQSWMGFEFESDWNSREARADAISWVWDNIAGCSFDLEGGRGYSTEITLPPQEVSKYAEGTAEFQKMMQGLCAMDGRGLGSDDMVGTHLNISTPLMRDGSAHTTSAKFMLNHSLASLDNTERATLFARSPTYGGAFDQSTYIELKVFRSTYSYEEFQEYVRRGLNIVKVVEAWEQDPRSRNTTVAMYCSNFFRAVEYGELPQFEPVPLGTLTDPCGRDQPYVSVGGSDSAYWEGYEHNDYWDDERYDDEDEECNCSDCVAYREDF